MAATVEQRVIIIFVLGFISYLLGVIAENKKPAAGTPISVGVTMLCMYPFDPTVGLGYLSVFFLIVSSVVGYCSLFYPYEGRHVPKRDMLKHPFFEALYYIAMSISGLAGVTLLCPTITQHHYLKNNVHRYVDNKCPTAKTGILGGGAILSFMSSLFWLVALWVGGNARKDFFNEQHGNNGESGTSTSEANDAQSEPSGKVAGLPDPEKKGLQSSSSFFKT